MTRRPALSCFALLMDARSVASRHASKRPPAHATARTARATPPTGRRASHLQTLRHIAATFQVAAGCAVRPPCQLGDVLPVPGLTPDDVARVTAYIRMMQRRAGI